VLPYVLLGLAWVGSNPPGAAPDESDHLIKALAAGKLDIGEKLEDRLGETPIARRNISISRVVTIPGALAPDGYGCFAFNSQQTAACLPVERPGISGSVERVTTVGAYPPFAYVLPGVAARRAVSPYGAFRLARLTLLMMCSGLLLIGAWHLVHWLGRWSLVGALVGLTPMAVFSASIVSTSGLEISAAFAVAAVVVTASRRPASLADTRTLAALAGTGTCLILSRQTGIVTFAVVMMAEIFRTGWQPLRQAATRCPRAVIGSVSTLMLSTMLLAAWEFMYDKPAETGRVFSYAAWMRFLDQAFGIIHSGIGVFGWLDTPLPLWAVACWSAVAVLSCGMALMLGNRRDRWCLGLVLLATLAVTYVTYATMFHSITASLQGRHMLPLFVFSPTFAGVVLVERLRRDAPDAVTRLYNTVAVTMGILQFVAVYCNARRYAVGTRGSMLFFNAPAWSPRFGWLVWLFLAAAGSLLLVVFGVRCGAYEKDAEEYAAQARGVTRGELH
jgi:hypothetical protein